CTPSHCIKGAQATETLIEAGANVNADDKDKCTPSHVSRAYRQQKLIEAGLVASSLATLTLLASVTFAAFSRVPLPLAFTLAMLSVLAATLSHKITSSNKKRRTERDEVTKGGQELENNSREGNWESRKQTNEEVEESIKPEK
ncbi:unnamed protein product, partial [Brugia timori]|uniref:ANK_REP_REGION domain-containing protein n=1 Tax=Brugia timori TaxID=42155 RepID=A0A0R3QYB4_9BILA